jgi:hypothetical protein
LGSLVVEIWTLFRDHAGSSKGDDPMLPQLRPLSDEETEPFNDLVELVLASISRGDRSAMQPVMHQHLLTDVDESDGAVIIHLHEKVIELVGGAEDGQAAYSGFLCNLVPLIGALAVDDPAEVVLSCESLANGNLGDMPHVRVSGSWRGRRVSVCVHTEPPAGLTPRWRCNQAGQLYPMPERS